MAFSSSRSMQLASSRLFRVTQWTITDAERCILPRNKELVRSITFDNGRNQQRSQTTWNGLRPKKGCLAVMNSDRTDFGLSKTHKDVSKRAISVSSKRFAQEMQKEGGMGHQTQENDEKAPEKPLTQRQKLARTFAAYGSTAVVFHTAISLTSLGTCYLVVSRYVSTASSLLDKSQSISHHPKSILGGISMEVLWH